MSNRPLESESPFEYAARMAVIEDNLLLLKNLEGYYALSALEAKSVWLSCPQYQEKFCRRRIKASKKRGGNEYGNKVFLKRRFKLEGQELDDIFEEFWLAGEDTVSQKFLDSMSPHRIAKVQLTEKAQIAIEKLATTCGLR